MKLKNEKGVTLVELLAVLVLVSMVASIILTTFINVNSYNVTEMKKLKMQQDANYIVTTLLQKHRTVNHSYTLKLEANKLVYMDGDTGIKETIGENFYYDMTKIIVGDESFIKPEIIFLYQKKVQSS